MAKQLTINVAGGNVDEVIEQLNIVGIINLYYELPIETTVNDNGYGYEIKEEEQIQLHIIVEEETDVKDTVNLVSKTLNILPRDIAQDDINLEVDHVEFEDILLENGWKLQYGETVGNRQGKTIYLDPQGAFGTGIHETTQDCLKMVLAHQLNGNHVIDIGTGSGVLAIAASLKGAANVTAIDIEPVEREVLLQAKLNNVSNVLVQQADILEGDFEFSQKVDWVIINIGAEETVRIVERHRLYERTNYFLVSGVVDWNEEKVKAYFRKLGFKLIERKQTYEWVTALYRKLEL